MEDGVVTEEEIKEQQDRVTKLLKKLERISTPEQINQVRELLAEISVLISIRNLNT